MVICNSIVWGALSEHSAQEQSHLKLNSIFNTSRLDRSRLQWRSALLGREFQPKTSLLEATVSMTDKMKKKREKKKPPVGEWPADLQQSHALGRCVQSSPWPLTMKVDSEEQIQREEEHWMRWVSSRRELESTRKTTEAHKTFYWYITSALTEVREPHTIDSTCEE